MTDASGDRSDGSGPSAAEAFALLGDDTRVEILRAAVDAGGLDVDADPLSFSELLERVDVADSARFNYHLGQLVGHFLRRTDEGSRSGRAEDGGYEFTYAGRRIVRAIRAGTFTDRAEASPTPVDGTCAVCGDEALVAAYEDERFHVRCDACGAYLTANDFPPGGVADRPLPAALRAFDRLVRHRVSFAVDGICPECTGRTEGGVYDDPPDSWPSTVLPVYTCRRCGYWVMPSYGMAVLDHSEVVAFHRERGVDLREPPYWDLALCVTDRYVEVASRDPWRVHVEVPLDGDRLRAVVDGDGRVADVTVE